MFSVRCAQIIWIAGGSPAAGYLSCFAKKGNPKKATPIHRPYGVPCVARQAGRLRNSRFALRQSSPKSPDSSALLGGGPRGIQTEATHPHPGLPLEEEGTITLSPFGGKFEYSTLYAHHPVTPLHRLGFPKRSGAVGEDCLSAKREFRSRPIFSENRGKPEGPVRRGALLFGYLYFGQAK
jgi:hypothetical protein